MILRSYQNTAIRNLYAAMRESDVAPRLILKLPTGAGKTFIAASIIQHGKAHGKKILFLVDRLTLLSQTQESFFNLGIHSSCIQGENTNWMHGDDVIVGSIQTLEKWTHWPEVDLVIVDESHDQRQGLYAQMDRWDNVPFIGLTATPFTTGLGLHWHRVVDGPSVKELIELGFLSKFEAWGCPPDLKGVKTTAGDYNSKALAEKVNTMELTGNIAKHYREHAADRQGLIFAVDIAHSKSIARQMTESGISCSHIDCYAEDDEKYRIIDAFRAGEIQCLTSVTILAKGFDVPQVGAIVLARPTKSLSLYIQQVGRGLRTAEGKDNCVILDHAGNCSRFGLPDSDFSRPLCEKKKGVSGSDQAKPEPKPKECPACTFMKAPGVHECPNCGFKPERRTDVGQNDTKLVRLRGGSSKGDKQAVWSQLLGEADRRGYSRGWVSHKYRKIFGVWPRGLVDVRAEPTAEIQKWVTSENIRYAKRRDQ